MLTWFNSTPIVNGSLRRSLPVVCDAVRDSLRRRRSGIINTHASEGSLDPRSGEQVVRVGETVGDSYEACEGALSSFASLCPFSPTTWVSSCTPELNHSLYVSLQAVAARCTWLHRVELTNFSRSCINDLVTRSHMPFVVALHPLGLTPAANPTLTSGDDFF